MLNPMPKKIVTVSDFQRKTKPTFDDISNSKDPVLVLNRNKQVGVFMNPKVYNKFLEAYEDYLDSKELEEAVENLKDEPTISLDDIKTVYKKQ